MRTIEATAIVDAPPTLVWNVLAAAAEYRDWNPFILDVTGTFVVGARPRIRVAPVGRRAMTFRPRVVEATPPSRLRWIGRVGVRGLCDAEHEFVLTGRPDGKTELTQRETFRGVLVPLLAGALEPTRQGFVRMHNALGRRVALRRPQP